MATNISWAAPAQGSTGQQIQYRAVDNPSWTTFKTVSSSANSDVISGLNGGSYEFRIVNLCASGVTTASSITTYTIA